MRRLNSSFSDRSSEKWKTPYVDIIAVGTIQFFLALPLLCYGVLLMQFISEDFYNLNTGLWTVVTFVAAYKITYPWTKSYCKHLENIKHKIHKRNVIIFVLILFGELVMGAFYSTPTTHIVFYGIFGGVSSSIIYVHLKFVTAEAFNSQVQLFDILNQIMKPFSLIFMPHLILFLANLYGTAQSQLIMAGLLLNIIPACLLVRTTKQQKLSLCKFQTMDRLSVEMTELTPKPPIIKEQSTSSEEEDDEEEDLNELEIPCTPPSSPTESSSDIQKYFQNVGVKILQKIPEESETEEEDDINEITSKRLSRISAILQGLNENPRKSVNLSVNNLFQPDEVIESVVEEPEISEFINGASPKKSRCFSISSDAIYNWRLRKRKFKSFLYKNFVKSFPRTLKTLHFYPAVISSCITTILSTIIFAAAPCRMININYPSTPDEATFILTIIGFTWLFFLAGYPVFSTLSSLKIKVLFLVGLSISGLSLFIMHKFSYDNFTLFSLTFGLGHGIVCYTENIAHEDFFGMERWKMLQGTLEICTGYIVILVYLIIYLSYLEIDIFLTHAYWLYVFNVALWIVAYIVKLIVTRVKSVRRYNVQRYPNFNF